MTRCGRCRFRRDVDHFPAWQTLQRDHGEQILLDRCVVGGEGGCCQAGRCHYRNGGTYRTRSHGVSCVELDRCELRRIRKNAPDRLSRRHDRGCQSRVAVLQKREDLEDQQVIRSPELGKRGLELPLVKSPELVQQVVDLITDCDFGEDANGFRFLEACLQRCQVQRRRFRLRDVGRGAAFFGGLRGGGGRRRLRGGRGGLGFARPCGSAVDGVAAALAGSIVVAPLCAALGAGRLGGTAGSANGAPVSAPVWDDVAGDGATGGGGFVPAQPAVRSMKRRPTMRAPRMNDSSARISTERSVFDSLTKQPPVVFVQKYSGVQYSVAQPEPRWTCKNMTVGGLASDTAFPFRGV